MKMLGGSSAFSLLLHQPVALDLININEQLQEAMMSVKMAEFCLRQNARYASNRMNTVMIFTI